MSQKSPPPAGIPVSEFDKFTNLYEQLRPAYNHWEFDKLATEYWEAYKEEMTPEEEREFIEGVACQLDEGTLELHFWERLLFVSKE